MDQIQFTVKFNSRLFEVKGGEFLYGAINVSIFYINPSEDLQLTCQKSAMYFLQNYIWVSRRIICNPRENLEVIRISPEDFERTEIPPDAVINRIEAFTLSNSVTYGVAYGVIYSYKILDRY